ADLKVSAMPLFQGDSPHRSFVFIDIPGSFVQFLVFQVHSDPVPSDILSKPIAPARQPASCGSPRTDHASAEQKRKSTNRHSPISSSLLLCPDMWRGLRKSRRSRPVA